MRERGTQLEQELRTGERYAVRPHKLGEPRTASGRDEGHARRGKQSRSEEKREAPGVSGDREGFRRSSSPPPIAVRRDSDADVMDHARNGEASERTTEAKGKGHGRVSGEQNGKGGENRGIDRKHQGPTPAEHTEEDEPDPSEDSHRERTRKRRMGQQLEHWRDSFGGCWRYARTTIRVMLQRIRPAPLIGECTPHILGPQVLSSDPVHRSVGELFGPVLDRRCGIQQGPRGWLRRPGADRWGLRPSHKDRTLARQPTGRRWRCP